VRRESNHKQQLLLLKHPNVVDYEGRTGLSPPATYHIVPWGGTHFLANTMPDTTSTLDARISLKAFKRNPIQPRE
jgi:hypothetical protein